MNINTILLVLASDARLADFGVVDIINAINTDKPVVLYSSRVLDKDIAPVPSYITKCNDRMICINYGIRRTFPIATINIWPAREIVIDPAPFE